MDPTQVTISELTSDREHLLSSLKLKYTQIYTEWLRDFCENSQETDDYEFSGKTEQPTLGNTEILPEIDHKFITTPDFMYS